MCGILAIAGKNIPQDKIASALGTLGKRGPDDSGMLAYPRCTLGHTRLSILDLSGGHQPMQDAQKTAAITFNGEIYNYRELRQELEKLGHRFATNSDTEVILAAYKEWGEECPEHLDGMFAFALWDEKEGRLFMARDRFGKKPLYYARTADGGIAVASEIKALFAAGIRGVLDPKGIDAYLALMYIPPWRSVYSNVHVLPPAHRAMFKNGSLATSRYWEIPMHPLSISYPEAKEEVHRLFTEAVKKRMVADVEIGSFLSGGVDSTIVTAYAQQFADHPLKTFSLGYGEHINELPFAQEAAHAIGTDHHTLQATSTLTTELEKMLAYFDEPHGDSSDFPQHLVSELAANKVKVALSGDGGDELFLGYGWYWSYWNSRKITRLKNAITLSNPFREHMRSITVFSERARAHLWKDPSSAVGAEPLDQLVSNFPGNGIQKINRYDIEMYLPGQLLTKVDQASMMHSLEVRCPLLDYQLAEFAWNLPESFKTDRHTGKLILKDLLREIMPDTFVDRKKQGFGAPVRKWLSEEKMRAYVENQFAKGAPVFEILREEPIRALIARTFAGQNPKNYYRVWVLLCLAIWMQKHRHEYAL